MVPAEASTRVEGDGPDLVGLPSAIRGPTLRAVDGLLRRFCADLRRHSLLPEDGRVVVAVSGGTDSVVLLDLFHRVAVRDGLHLVVAHANHQLRGDASDHDETFVLRLAARLGHPAVSGRLDVRAEMARARTSVEMSARKLRHAFLVRTAVEQRASVIALAHHADDQAELFLLRLLRGAGGEGLGGMAWNSPSSADPSRTLVRPLLGLSKADLVAHLKAKRLESREDSSNKDRDILRNRVRHELLPMLEQDFTPAIRDVLCRAAEVVGTEAGFVKQAAEQWSAATARPDFSTLHPALQRAVLREQLREAGHEGGFDLVEKLRQGKAAVTVAAGGRLAHDGNGRIRIGVRPAPPRFRDEALTIDLGAGRGTVDFGGGRLEWRVRAARGPKRPAAAAGREQLDADRVGPVLRLRHWRAGDRFRPLGSPGSAKIQDLFVDRKIPASERRGRVLAEATGGELCWIEGLPPGEAFKLTPATGRQLELRWVRGGGDRLPVLG